MEEASAGLGRKDKPGVPRSIMYVSCPFAVRFSRIVLDEQSDVASAVLDEKDN